MSSVPWTSSPGRSVRSLPIDARWEARSGRPLLIMGPSGAGKSTLLHILGMHDSAWTGEYYLHR